MTKVNERHPGTADRGVQHRGTTSRRWTSVVLQGERERASDNRVLALQARRDPPAPRGVPQVEVTFEIDANGILHVSAKDKDTGAEQSITITDTTTLDQSEVERMIADAERNRADDARLRGGRRPQRARRHRLPGRAPPGRPRRPRRPRAGEAEMLVADAREAVKSRRRSTGSIP